MIRATVLAFLVTAASTEKGCQKEIPIWRGNVYVGNSIEQSIERKQALDKIFTNDPSFDEFICIRRSDFDCFFETYIVNASGWKRQSACGLIGDP